MARKSAVRIAAEALAVSHGFEPCSHPDCNVRDTRSSCASTHFFRKATALAEDALAAGIELQRQRGKNRSRH